ncbi:SDR family NAD(P)-dependent oxidoreductase [Parasphingopyxis marina]|uniref:SDR family oxidoreductase n=1 Tax=Parasphingopyxis marina TaxID=2761622 RepID=A0A842HUD8_9SPHN|nr:SDR family oxidoreductase [Parasphingopyxis marina]MBC2776632.1 SDR family oxidoreductase [Parasphingopyxis marina]
MMFSAFDLSGKVALVTGGNSGLGLGMAHALAEAGAAVAIWGVNGSRNRDALADLGKAGHKVLVQKVDVSDEAAVEAGVAEILSRFGRLDSAVANAGISQLPQPFHALETENYRRTLAVNLDGVIWTFRAACRHMVERAKGGDPGGSLLGISSLTAIEGAAMHEAYAASKGGVRALMKGLAVEYARYGVRANSLHPGWFRTNMADEFYDSEPFAAKILPRIPARRPGTGADLGGIAVYLASDASSYHSGDEIVIDGGYSVF